MAPSLHNYLGKAVLGSVRPFPLVPPNEGHGIQRRVHAGYLIFHRTYAEKTHFIHAWRGVQSFGSPLFPG